MREIRQTIEQCRTPAERSSAVADLSAHFGVSSQRIYDLTRGLRPPRKARSDKGTRSFDVDTSEDAQLLYGWIDLYGISTAEAVNIARANGMDVPVSFSTIDRYLRADGLGRSQRRNPTTPHRRFESKRPGDRFQFDISGLKTRMFDRKSRRIVTVSKLDVSENHPNTDPNRVKVWRFSLIDDFSRRTYIRYYAVDKPNSTHVVDFLLRAYSVMGVPLQLYTDNDAVIVGGRNKRATEVLNKVLRDRGGYELITHLPGNARATGKVERLHLTVEQEEKVLGIYIQERGFLTIDVLNDRLAVGFMHRKNNDVHSETGQRPMDRWHSVLSQERLLDYDELHSAFMVDEHNVLLRGDCTFRIKGVVYQLPTTNEFPFIEWAAMPGKRIDVVFPDASDFFTVIADDLTEYDVPKSVAVPDVAGEFKSSAETRAQRIRKETRAVAKADAKRKKETGDHTIIPIIDLDSVAAQAAEPRDQKVLKMPKPSTHLTREDVARVAPGRVAVADPRIDYWAAFKRYADHFAAKSDAKSWLDSIYPSRDGWMLLSELETAFAARDERSRLKAVS